jgi:CheY-like chemotaxis protein
MPDRLPLAVASAKVALGSIGLLGSGWTLFGALDMDHLKAILGLIGAAFATVVFFGLRDFVPLYISARKQLKMMKIDLAAMDTKVASASIATDELGRVAEANRGDITELKQTLDRLRDKDGIIDAQREELKAVSLQYASLALTVGRRLGLVADEARDAEMALDDSARVSGTVLIVEDDPASYIAYQGLFRFRGVKTSHAVDGETAISLLAEGPACVVLDLMLHGPLGGEAVLKHIREHDLPVRVVVQTGMIDSEWQKLLGSVAPHRPDAVIKKPIRDFDEFLAAVRGDPPAIPAPTKGDHR